MANASSGYEHLCAQRQKHRWKGQVSIRIFFQRRGQLGQGENIRQVDLLLVLDMIRIRLGSHLASFARGSRQRINSDLVLRQVTCRGEVEVIKKKVVGFGEDHLSSREKRKVCFMGGR